MSDVLIDLPRQVSWRASEDAPERAYGPGRALVPAELASSLKAQGLIIWMEEGAEAPKWSETDRLIPSAELAPDFPAREYLFLAGHTTYKHVADLTAEQIASLRGVGEARAKQILEAQTIVREKLPKRIDPESLTAKVFVIDPADVPAGEAEMDATPLGCGVKGESDGTQPSAE